MKLSTWNVNSINARMDRLLEYLDSSSPDVLCLQETKCLVENFPKDTLKHLGYESIAIGQKTFNGVAILSKKPIVELDIDLNQSVIGDQARLIAAKILDITVVSVYVPNGGDVSSPKFQYKMDWFDEFLLAIQDLANTGAKVIVAGDFNITTDDRDIYDPVEWEGQILCSPQERQVLSKFLELGFVDTFRLCNPELSAFSWWDYRQLAFPKNKGARIDYVFCTENLKDCCHESEIHRFMRKGKKPSDHAPVCAVFDLS